MSHRNGWAEDKRGETALSLPAFPLHAFIALSQISLLLGDWNWSTHTCSQWALQGAVAKRSRGTVDTSIVGRWHAVGAAQLLTGLSMQPTVQSQGSWLGEVTDRKGYLQKLRTEKGLRTLPFGNPHLRILSSKMPGKELAASKINAFFFSHLWELEERRKMLFYRSSQQTLKERREKPKESKYVTSWSISSCKVPSLDHEVFDHTMEFTSFVSVSSLRKWNNECNTQFCMIIWK